MGGVGGVNYDVRKTFKDMVNAKRTGRTGATDMDRSCTPDSGKNAANTSSSLLERYVIIMADHTVTEAALAWIYPHCPNNLSPGSQGAPRHWGDILRRPVLGGSGF